MVKEILTVSRMKSSKVGLKKETIQFSDILKKKYALFEDLIIQKDIYYDLDSPQRSKSYPRSVP